MPELSKKEKREILKAMGLMTQIGFTVVACVVAGVLLGNFLDGWLSTSPWLLIFFTFAGCFAGIKSIIDLAKKF